MKKLSLALITAASIALPQLTTAEDIEIYTGSDSYRKQVNSKIFIIFDNSGSMGATETVLNSYDPDQSYSGSGSATAFSDAAIYFNRGGVDFGVGTYPEGHFDSRRFNEFLLGCETAIERLNTVGYYTGYLMEYQVQGSSGSWQPFPGEMGLDKGNPVDCLDDILLKKGGNGKYKEGSTLKSISNGMYPYENENGNPKKDFEAASYTSDHDLASENATALFKDSQYPVTLFKANYLRYKNTPADEVGEVTDKTRLEIAKDTISEILNATPSVDFGMMVFNINYPSDGYGDGGRVVSKIQPRTPSVLQSMLDTVANIDAETNTPLCESLLETKRYLAGEAVNFGNKDYTPDDIKSYVPNTPPKDAAAETNGVYNSPFNECDETITVVLITDGEPTVDNFGDAAIKALPGIGEPFKYEDDSVNYLPALSKWMWENDINPSKEGKQNVVLHTISFGQDAITNAGALLKQAAENTGAGDFKGTYFEASTATKLLEALSEITVQTLEEDSGFTSPSVASNNFDRTRSLDNVYYAMFLPGQGPRWRGNIKKLKFKGDTLVDMNGDLALNNDGVIDPESFTFWNESGIPDGPDVRQGGVAAMLAQKTDRNLYTNVNGKLFNFDSGNVKSALGIVIDGVCDPLPCLEDKVIEDNIKWARGLDVDNDEPGDYRSDIFGDTLHSKPAVVSYSATDIRILVGTNAGFFHMFKDNDEAGVDETWAFMPAELFNNVPVLRKNERISPKVYGVDGSPVVHFSDANGDGVVGDGDKVWVFFGLRRGGNSYYAMDITNPDSPKLMWKIDNNSTGFSELGQSWSTPVVSYMAANGVKPVLVFGAGYSTNKDLPGARTEDPEGRGIFVVDAQTGELVWRLTPDTGFTGKHSVAGSVAVMDSDQDGYTDRMYFADTAGSIWRVDAVGPISDWTHYEFARVSDLTDADDRRFFYEPVVARTFTRVVEETEIEVDGVKETIVTRSTVPFDAITIGSGTRPNPLGTDTQDKLFMLKDMRVVSATVTSETKPSPILIADLLAISSTEPKTVEAREQFEKEMTSKAGWYYSLAQTEKSLSPATVLGGVAYFTTYTPVKQGVEIKACEINLGGGQLYAFDLIYGTRVYKRLSFDVGESIPDSPELFLGEDAEGNSQLYLLNSDGDDTDGVHKGAQQALNNKGEAIGLKTSRTYIFMGENQ